MRQRLEFIDIAKGIGIILVVIGHSIGWLVPYHWIYSFHMPFFFFISGFLFTIQGKNFLTFTKKRIRSLLLPAMFCTILLYSIDYCYPILDNSEKNWRLPFALWFLPVLFMTEMYGFVFVKNIEKSKHIKSVLFFLLISLATLGYVFYLRCKSNPFMVLTVPNALFFYLLGWSFRQYGVKTLDCKKPFVHIVFLYLLILIFVKYDLVVVAMVYNQFDYPFLSHVVAFLGIYATLLLAKTLCGSLVGGTVANIGKYTLEIMLLHQLYLSLCDNLMRSYFSSLYLYKIFQWTITSILLYISIILFKKKPFKCIIGK